jgi:hypothetical protein
MKSLSIKLYLILSVFLLSLSSCEAIKGIFKAGVWVGVLIVIVILAVVIAVIRGITGKK